MNLDRHASCLTRHISPGDPRWGSAVIGVPIAWDGEIIGTFAIFSDGHGRTFITAEASLVELIANHAAIASMISRLHNSAAGRERETAVAGERERALRDAHEVTGPAPKGGSYLGVGFAAGAKAAHCRAVLGLSDPRSVRGGHEGRLADVVAVEPPSLGGNHSAASQSPTAAEPEAGAALAYPRDTLERRADEASEVESA